MRVILDIDNTLWNFANPLFSYLKKINSNIPHYYYWNSWDFFLPYISEKDFYDAVEKVHKEQDIYAPYKGASELTKALKDVGAHITVASHRKEQTRTVTELFLNSHNILFDELHLSNDKTPLFTNALYVIDDAPHLIEEAHNRGCKVFSLSQPWNKTVANKAVMCLNLEELKKKIIWDILYAKMP